MTTPEEKLIDHCRKLARAMNAQDNRSTSWPLFVIQEKQKLPAHEDFADEFINMTEEGRELADSELCAKCREEVSERGAMTWVRTDAPCETCGYYKTYPIEEKWVEKLDDGVFLTGELCDAYIQGRRYHFGKDVRSYAISASASADMAMLLHFISQLGDEPNKNAYPF